MEFDWIWKRFLQLTGQTAEEAAPWENLCREAQAEISACARPSILGGEMLLCATAATLAFYRYSLVQAAEPETGFAAGEIKITKGTQGIAAAEKLWQQARCAAAPYLLDKSFVFWQVQS